MNKRTSAAIIILAGTKKRGQMTLKHSHPYLELDFRIYTPRTAHLIDGCRARCLVICPSLVGVKGGISLINDALPCMASEPSIQRMK